jgi:hypothetical protein
VKVFGVGGQAFPQLPQLFTLVNRCTSQPSAVNPLQLAKKVAQLTIEHKPPTQFELAFGTAQTFPQPLQLFTFVSRFVSHPSVILLLQSAKFGVQI